MRAANGYRAPLTALLALCLRLSGAPAAALHLKATLARILLDALLPLRSLRNAFLTYLTCYTQPSFMPLYLVMAPPLHPAANSLYFALTTIKNRHGRLALISPA